MGNGSCVGNGCSLRVDLDTVELGPIAGDPGSVGGVGVCPLFSGQVYVESVVYPESVGSLNEDGHCVDYL